MLKYILLKYVQNLTEMQTEIEEGGDDMIKILLPSVCVGKKEPTRP